MARCAGLWADAQTRGDIVDARIALPRDHGAAPAGRGRVQSVRALEGARDGPASWTSAAIPRLEGPRIPDYDSSSPLPSPTRNRTGWRSRLRRDPTPSRTRGGRRSGIARRATRISPDGGGNRNRISSAPSSTAIIDRGGREVRPLTVVPAVAVDLPLSPDLARNP